jgi:hypothetical protein
MSMAQVVAITFSFLIQIGVLNVALTNINMHTASDKPLHLPKRTGILFR